MLTSEIKKNANLNFGLHFFQPVSRDLEMSLAEVERLFAVEGIGDAAEDEDVKLNSTFTFGLLALLFLL